MYKCKKRVLSAALAVLLMLGLMRGMSLTAFADQPPVTYLNASGERETCSSYNAVTSSNKTLKGGWNVVKESVTISDSQEVWDELNIILCDNATLTVATSEVAIASGEDFNIYAQSTGDSMGKLVASSQNDNALESRYSHITINGGRITATSNNDYGIKGANGVSINGGIVTASGGNGAFGIWNSVTNSIPGIGWTNTDGTEGKTLIEANQSEKLSYKKAQFPAKTADVTFKVVNGSWSDGSVEDKTASLFGPEDIDLKLAPSDIPEVGKAKDESFISGSWDVTPSADTVITGATTYTYTFKEKTEAHTHKIEHVEAKDPTCTEEGYEAHYECTVEGCGEWFEDETKSVPIDKEKFIKKATGHKWDKGVVTQEATYDETGIKKYTCSVCGETKEETIPVKTRRSSSSSDSSDSDSESSGGDSSVKSGSISTKSIDVNGNTLQTQPDSGAPLSDRGGNWGNQDLIWTYTKSDGSLAKGEWLNLEYDGHIYWYYFDDSTIMQTNWFDYNGSRYFLVPEMDGWRGRMATGWHMVDNKWYYFEPTIGANQGILLRGMTTPDGHTVGADGAWDGNGTTPVGAIHTGTTVTMN